MGKSRCRVCGLAWRQLKEALVNTATELLHSIVAWGKKDANIRRLVLVGSRARSSSSDQLADLDIQVYTESIGRYTGDDNWLSGINPVWLCVRDEYADGEILVPTRLVIFAGGVKVDFAFYPAAVNSYGIRAGFAHRILLDKAGTAAEREVECVLSTRLAKPSEEEFTRVVVEFWFEAYHVAKYLVRNELWLVKTRDWATKQFLLQMIEWHERPAQGGDGYDPGNQMRSWVSDETWDELQHVFARFERVESWGALLATMELFRRVATKTAANFGFAYPVSVDRNLSGFIIGLRDSSPNPTEGSGGR